MSEKIVQLNEEIIKGQLKELVRGSVEETLNERLEKEAESLTQAARYERSEARQGYRSGHYDWRTLPPPPATSRSVCCASRVHPSRPPSLSGWTVRSAAVLAWWGRSLMADAGLHEAAPCSGHPVGQQEVHEHEALGDSSGRCLYCRLTSFSRSLQIILHIILDGAIG